MHIKNVYKQVKDYRKGCTQCALNGEEMSINIDDLKECDIKAVKMDTLGVQAFNISVDAGSSETRTHIWNGNPKNGTVYAIDSAYSVITDDISGVQSQSDTLYDNMDIIMYDVTDNKQSKVFNEIHIVKGGLYEDLRRPAERTSSNEGKGLQDTTYINTIANIGLRLYCKALTDGVLTDTCAAKVTLALPQEDIVSTKRQDDVKERLTGVYVFELPRCGFRVMLYIDVQDILLFDEAQAVLGFWRIENKEVSAKYQNVMVVDAGGRSVDLSIMLKGRVIARGSYTCKFGGQKFIDEVIDKYINDTGKDMPTKQMVNDALDTGLLQDGNDSIDITKYISTAKSEICSDIMSSISALLDRNDIRMNQLNLVLCTGRLMKNTDNGSTGVEHLSSYINDAVKKISPNTDVGLVEDEHALVKGLSFARMAYDKKVATRK